jgi:hypothetical protein
LFNSFCIGLLVLLLGSSYVYLFIFYFLCCCLVTSNFLNDIIQVFLHFFWGPLALWFVFFWVSLIVIHVFLHCNSFLLLFVKLVYFSHLFCASWEWGAWMHHWVDFSGMNFKLCLQFFVFLIWMLMFILSFILMIFF